MEFYVSYIWVFGCILDDLWEDCEREILDKDLLILNEIYEVLNIDRMSSKPSGLRFSSVLSQTGQSQIQAPSTSFSKNSTISIVGKKPSTIVYTKNLKSNPSQTMQTTKKMQGNQSPYGM